MLKDRWFRLGLITGIVAAVCCFTPLAVGLLGVLGLGAFAVWLDVILLPVLAGSIALCVWAVLRQRRAG